MKDESKQGGLLKGSISKAVAVKRTSNWRNAVKVLFPHDATAVPKGFMIPIDDIEALALKYKDHKIAGVRAYFSLEDPEFKDGVHAVLVPVILEKGIDGADDVYRDLIIENPTNAGADDDTSIYDFTKPCPNCCDTDSPLFG